ncbi:MAG: TIGR03016 family PEP-CTERM system-associated outer membrane protein [Gammaproteobacteria bacterium]
MNALEWRLRPMLSMSEVFSDNLTLSNIDKKSGLVSEVAPGFSLYGSSPWSNFNLNYRLQGLYNAGGNDAFDLKNQLQMNSRMQLIRNTLFIQSSSSISQVNTTNSFIATDNLTGGRDRSETKNFSISPYWTPHFGQYASGLVKVDYRKTSVDNSSSTAGLISDSDTFSKQIRLTSGSKFSKIKWNLNYSSRDQSRAAGDDVKFESYQGTLRYFLDRKFSVFATAGYENNDYQTQNNSINNGVFYTVGGRWSPSRWYSLEAGYGNNKHVTVRFNPSPNLTGFVTYMNKDVGLNTGNSWNVNLNYRAQQAVVTGRYSQDTTTVQDVLFEQFIDLSTIEFDPENNRFIFDIINIPFLVNDVIVSKNANLTFGYRTGKSNYRLSLFNTQRSYSLRPQRDDVFGASAMWSWQFAPRFNFYLRPSWQSTSISNSDIATAADNRRYDVSLGLSRAIPINLGRPLMMNTRLEFRHINQMSDLSANDYSENRATANFFVRF